MGQSIRYFIPQPKSTSCPDDTSYKKHPFDLNRSFGCGRAWTTSPENGYLSIVLR
jgi:hypothetical protein